MSRWGDGIYDSDASLDYFVTITDRIEHELAYYFSPEQVMNNATWLAKALAIIEVMLLFDAHEIGSMSYLREPKAVRRWRDVFLNVWDGDWRHDDKYGSYTYPYDEPDYRKQHRPAIVALFDRLESIANEWATLSDQLLTPLHPDHPLPYFSISRWTDKDNKVHWGVERFTSQLMGFLVKEIIFYLSFEARDLVIGFNYCEDVWTAVDILGFLAEKYQRTPGINEKVVQHWRDLTEEIWKPLLTEGGMVWDESIGIYRTVKATFDRLEAIAKKYPPREW